MARDFEDLDDLDDLSDDELRDLVHSRIREHRGLDDRDIAVDVEDGIVRLEGRVGTEGERRVAEHIVTDVIGIKQVENELLVDPIRRAESPTATDDHLASEEAHEGLLLGDRPVPLSPEAEHRSPRHDDELRSIGTSDVHESTEHAVPWIPPERPTQEGLEGERIEPPARGEDH